MKSKTKTEIWKELISSMSTEQIGIRSLLVSMDEQTKENKLFQKLLSEEFYKRHNLKTSKK